MNKLIYGFVDNEFIINILLIYVLLKGIVIKCYIFVLNFEFYIRDLGIDF